MTSKEALLKLCFKYLPTIDEMHLNPDEDDEELLQVIQRDLETLENVKNKTNLFFSQRKQIAKEFNHWCVENNADALDSTNLVTWLLCFKLREWLGNDK